MLVMAYPDNCIKGIPNDSCLEVVSDGVVANVTLFPFHKDRRRADGWIEESVNWMDNATAVPFTLAQTKQGGEIQFKVGVGILPRADLDRVKRRYRGHLEYERAPLKANSYHGNILLKADISKHLMNQIRALLADASQVIRRGDCGQQG